MSNTIDQQVAEAAKAKGMTPLADSLGVKVSAAVEVMQKVWGDGFFEEMAKHGFVPSNQEEAEEMLKLAGRAVQFEQAATNQGSNVSIFKTANELVAKQLGENTAPEAARHHEIERQESLDKAALFVEQPGMMEHVLSLLDAEEILA